MGSPVTWGRYILTRIRSSVAQSIRSYELGDIKEREIYEHVYKNLVQGRLTFKRLIKGTEMSPTFASQGETLLIRSLPRPSRRSVFVGDVVMLKDPQNPERELVRRVAALEGEEMESSNPDDEPFHLAPGTCWVLCDNETLSPKDACDSRSFGPLPLRNIVGRAIYCSRSPVEHGCVQNSEDAMHADSPVLAVELDVEEMTRDKQKKERCLMGKYLLPTEQQIFIIDEVIVYESKATSILLPAPMHLTLRLKLTKPVIVNCILFGAHLVNGAVNGQILKIGS